MGRLCLWIVIIASSGFSIQAQVIHGVFLDFSESAAGRQIDAGYFADEGKISLYLGLSYLLPFREEEKLRWGYVNTWKAQEPIENFGLNAKAIYNVLNHESGLKLGFGTSLYASKRISYSNYWERPTVFQQSVTALFNLETNALIHLAVPVSERISLFLDTGVGFIFVYGDIPMYRVDQYGNGIWIYNSGGLNPFTFFAIGTKYSIGQ
jgi:hypothetical protein